MLNVAIFLKLSEKCYTFVGRIYYLTYDDNRTTIAMYS